MNPRGSSATDLSRLRDGSQQIAMLRRPPGRHAGGCTDAPLDDAVRSATALAASPSVAWVRLSRRSLPADDGRQRFAHFARQVDSAAPQLPGTFVHPAAHVSYAARAAARHG